MSWSVLDQLASSGSNFLLLFMVIYTSTTRDVGAFGLVYMTFFFLLVIVRGLSLEPLLVRFAVVPDDIWRRASAAAVGSALVLSVLIAVPMLALAMFFGGAVGSAFAALAVMLPGLLLQDSWRSALFCAGRPQSACLNDTAFLVMQGVGYLLLARFDALQMVQLILVWGVASYCAAFLGIIQCGVRPLPTEGFDWLKAHRDIGPAFAADYVANRGGEQVAMMLAGALGGLGTLGAVTVAQSLFAPLTTIQTGLNSFAMPEFSRLFQSGSGRDLRRLTWRFALLMGILMSSLGVLLAFVPRDIGITFFHDNWDPARRILLAMTVFSALKAVGQVLWLGLRSMQLAKPILYARAIFGGLTIVLTAAGAKYVGPNGAAWGLAIGVGGLLAVLVALFRFENVRLALVALNPPVLQQAQTDSRWLEAPDRGVASPEALFIRAERSPGDY